jgi:WD40 repeat protein
MVNVCVDERALIAVTGGGGGIVGGSVNGTSLHLIDLRMGRIVYEWQVSTSLGTVRSVSVLSHLNSSDGLRAPFVVVGHSSGYVSVVHLHTGQVRWQWHAHEGAITDIVSMTTSLVTASHDRNMALWSLQDPPSLIYIYKGHRDPVAGCAVIEHELFSIAGPRLGICPLHLPSTSANSPINPVVKIMHRTRIQKQTLKPNQLTALTAVPLHRLLVLGTEDGLIKFVSY